MACGCYCPQAPPVLARIEVRLCSKVSVSRTSAARHLAMCSGCDPAAPEFGTCVEFPHALFKSLTEICGQVSVKSFPGDEERESNLLFMGIHTLRLCAIVSLELAPA